jgi:hypothetical protein
MSRSTATSPASNDRFFDELISRYLSEVPLDSSGQTHVRMIRLEVEAVKAH